MFLQKRMTLAFSDEDMGDVIRIVKSLHDSVILIDRVSKTAEHETKTEESRYLGILLETLGASILRNLLNGKGVMRAGTRIVRPEAGYNNMDH